MDFCHSNGFRPQPMNVAILETKVRSLSVVAHCQQHLPIDVLEDGFCCSDCELETTLNLNRVDVGVENGYSGFEESVNRNTSVKE